MTCGRGESQYLDELAPAPSLAAADAKDLAAFKSLLETADRSQVALKTLTHEFLFRRSGRYCTEEDQKKFASAHNQVVGRF